MNCQRNFLVKEIWNLWVFKLQKAFITSQLLRIFPSSLPSLLILRRYFTRMKLFNNFRLSLFLSLHYAKLDPSPDDIQKGAVKLPKFMTTFLSSSDFQTIFLALKGAQGVTMSVCRSLKYLVLLTLILPRITVSRSHQGEVMKMASKFKPPGVVTPAGGAGYKVSISVNIRYLQTERYTFCSTLLSREVWGKVQIIPHTLCMNFPKYICVNISNLKP